MKDSAPERDAIERRLLEALEEAQSAYESAKPEEREAAKKRYLEALGAFNQFLK